jgi:PAS domain S-box-containing protein
MKPISFVHTNKEQLLVELLDHLPLALFCKDYTQQKGVFVAWNTTAEQLWGPPKEKVIGASDFDFFPKIQAQSFQKKDLEVLSSNNEVFIEEEAVDSPTVGRRIVQTWKVPINNQYILGISQDITKRKTLELELKKQTSASLQASKMASLGEMAGSIAHEINNPLTIILSAAQVIERRAQENNDDTSIRFADIISTTVERISKITNSVLRFSRHNERVQPSLYAFNEKLNDTLALCTEKLNNLNITFFDLIIRCNKTEIIHVLLNILNNAVDAVRNVSSPKIEVSIQKNKTQLEIRVSDSGIGIDQQTSLRLFEPFFTTKNVGEGTGLGMSLSRKIIEDHHGTITFEQLRYPTICFVSLPIIGTCETKT